MISNVEFSRVFLTGKKYAKGHQNTPFHVLAMLLSKKLR